MANAPILILLNSGGSSLARMLPLWGHFGSVICADGGANFLYDSAPASERGRFIPAAIKGDLDSLRPEVGEYYAARGCSVLRDADQDTNDLEKCILLVQELQAAGNGRAEHGVDVVVYGAFGGRFDQQMSSVHALYKFRDSPSIMRIVLLGEGNAAQLLGPGKHRVALTAREGPGCSLLPIGGPCVVSTKGLQWDMQQARLEFGGLISSSNRAVRREEPGKEGGEGAYTVDIECDGHVVWCCDVSI